MTAMTDLDIARSVTPRPIDDIAAELGLRPDEIERYGVTKAKVTLEGLERVERENPRGKYVVMTAITPTPLGEGKTTTTVGVVQGLNRIGHRAAVAIRQPSLGPVFGIKGGAAGGGYSQVIPMEDFNLHLTGDVHAIGAAHNLASAFLDNSLHHGNPLDIDPFSIRWPRVVDISDRALRNVNIGLGGRLNGVPRESEFVITVASEVMAILALATDVFDLRARLGRIVMATDRSGEGRDRGRPAGGRCHDRAAARRHQAQPAADARGRAGVRARWPLRQHRPRQQLHPGRPRGARHQSTSSSPRPASARTWGHRSSSTSSAGPRAWRPTVRSWWPRSGRSRCTAVSGPSWPASRSTRRSSRRTPRRCASVARTSRRTSRWCASTACRWWWPPTPSPATPSPSSRPSARWPWRPARVTPW